MHNTRRQPSPSTRFSLVFAWRYCLLVLCSLLLISCSSTKMAYEFLDWAAMWKIDRMVKLDTEQRKTTKDAIRSAHGWHRKTQLPLYADYLEGLQQRLRAGPVTGAQLHTETDRVQLLLDASVEHILPTATEVISSLSDHQVGELLDNIAEERAEYVEEYIEPGAEKLQKKNADEFKDQFKRFAGRLTREQESWIEDWSKALLPYTELSSRQQLLWQEHLSKYLVLRDNKTLLQQGLRELMLYRTDNWEQELRKVMDENQALTYDLIARLLNNLTPRQEERLHQHLQGYIKDFRELARKG